MTEAWSNEQWCDRCNCISSDVRVRQDVTIHTTMARTPVSRKAQLCDFCYGRLAGTEPDPVEAALASGEAW